MPKCQSIRGYTQPVAEIAEECATQNKFDIQVVREFIRTGQIPPSSEPFYNFLECFYKREGYIDDQGFILYSAIEKFLAQSYQSSVARKVVEPCESVQTGSSLGEKVYNAAKCLSDKLQEIQKNTV